MFYSMESIKQANRAVGGHWFSKGAMGFFGSRIESDVLRGRFFITSECMDEDRGTPRKFTVRAATDDGEIRDPSGFFRFESKEEALHWLDVACKHGVETANQASLSKPLSRAFEADLRVFEMQYSP